MDYGAVSYSFCIMDGLGGRLDSCGVGAYDSFNQDMIN